MVRFAPLFKISVSPNSLVHSVTLITMSLPNIRNLEEIRSRPNKHVSRFREGLLKLKRLWNVSEVLQKFWAETFSVLCFYDRYLDHVWAYSHSKTFHLITYQPNGLWYNLYRLEQSTKFQKFVRLYLVGILIRIHMFSNTNTDQECNQNHIRQRRRTYLNKDTRSSLTNFWNLVDSSGR